MFRIVHCRALLRGLRVFELLQRERHWRLVEGRGEGEDGDKVRMKDVLRML